ncbi:MAG: DNA polymerase III subunit alpha [Candidatus Gracilibacteria bacterium]
MSFVHLHVHSHYSLLDGFGTPKSIIQRAKELGMPAVALTDHGVLYGAIEFYKAAKAEGIKPIIGCEVYVAPGSRFDKTPGSENKPYHLILLATSAEGYMNLMKLVSQAHVEGFYYKPRMDHGLMKAHSKGIIALSSCLAGEVAQAVASGDEQRQIDVIRKYQDIFGAENFYLELQDHPFIDEQKTLNDRLIELSKITGAPLVATQDSHYVRSTDHQSQDILLCIQTQSTLGEEGRMKFQGDFSLRSAEDMKESFGHVPEALENSLKIAERCNIELDFGKNLIPNFKTPGNETSQSYLRKLCEEGLRKKYGDPPPEKAIKQLEYELDVVHRMGFDDYFLIVWDFVRYAKDAGITVGPGRGSAAGSLITYTLNITQLDPLRYGLIFERFLNPERVSMPDIDIDFADTRRNEVLDYVTQKYGRECVAQIITFGTMAARAAVRDVGRAMGYPYAEVDKIAKLVPPPVQGRHIPLKQSIEEDPELKNLYWADPRAKALLDNAIQLEGSVRHAGTHASAVVMSEKPLVNYTPLQRSTGGGEEIITQYSMKPIEEIGLLKMDFLGLKNLTIIQGILVLLRSIHQQELVLEDIPMDDPKTFDLLQKGDTTGVFQLESAGMRRYIRELKPTRFEDIIAMISLYRPGPMEWIPQYIRGKHQPDSVRYLHPSFESILKETNGVAIYQEQILQLARDFAGFSLGEADILRKAVGKKIPALLNEQKEKLVKGAVAKGHQEKFAVEVFEKVIEPFAGYGFNKAHAACYAMISYQTAYLKAHYPTEFMASLLSADADNTDRIILEINECNEMGIAVLPPSINESFLNFTVVDSKTIRFGLGAIKGLGGATVEEILAARKQGKFATLDDFLKRVPAKLLNKKTLEALAYSGALDDFGDRKVLALSYDELSQFSKYSQEVNAQGQTDIFGMMTEPDQGALSFQLKEVIPASFMEKLTWEKEYLGLYVSGHPLKGLRKYLAKKVTLIDTLTKRNIGKTVKLGGLMTGMKRVFTKAGSYMAYASLEDPTGRIEIAIFPKVFSKFQTMLQEDHLFMMEGRLDLRRDTFQFSVNSITPVSLDSMIKNAQAVGLYDANEKIVRKLKVLEGASSDPLEEEFGPPPPPPAQDTEWQENPFVLEVPGTVDLPLMESIKKVLLENPGERRVELHITTPSGIKKMKLPFTVGVNETLQQQLKQLGALVK